MPAGPRDEMVSTILAFFDEIGITYSYDRVSAESFLPGIEVRQGGLVIDRESLQHPGDLLHEAGHLAVAPPVLRPSLNGEVVIPGTDANVLELIAMLWSYAACLHLKIEPATVFHEGGYHGRSKSILANFEIGVFLGVHELEAVGMTLSPADAARRDRKPFPFMQKWLRD